MYVHKFDYKSQIRGNRKLFNTVKRHKRELQNFLNEII